MAALAGGGQVVAEAAKPDKRHSMRNRNLAAAVAGTNVSWSRRCRNYMNRSGPRRILYMFRWDPDLCESTHVRIAAVSQVSHGSSPTIQDWSCHMTGMVAL